MKEKILEISDNLRNGEITEIEAQNQFLFLFSVSESLTVDKIKTLGFEYEQKLNKGFRYEVDRTYQIYHFKEGLKKANEYRNENSR